MTELPKAAAPWKVLGELCRLLGEDDKRVTRIVIDASVYKMAEIHIERAADVDDLKRMEGDGTA